MEELRKGDFPQGKCGATERDWKAWVPLEVVKSSKGDMRIGGIATDENAKDLQGEKVFISGLDTSYLTQRGAFNWDHQKDPGAILGEVDTVQKNVDKGTMYVEGFLYPKVPKAVEVYNLMQSMKETGSNRKLGLSLEGKVKERDTTGGKQIRKAWIKNVAVTYNPINQGTWVDMIKSLGDFTFEQCTDDCSKCSYGVCENTEKAFTGPGAQAGATGFASNHDPRAEDTIPRVCEKCGKPRVSDLPDGCTCWNYETQQWREGVQEIPLEPRVGNVLTEVEAVPDAHEYAGVAEKAIAAGHDIPATSGGVSGSALREEELEKDPKVQTYDERFLKEHEKKRKKMFTKAEIFDLFLKKGYSDTNAALATILICKAVEIPGYTRIRRGKFERIKAHRRETGSVSRQGPGEFRYRKFGANIPDPTDPSAGDTVELPNGVRGRITGMSNTDVEVTVGSGRVASIPKVVLSGDWEPRKSGEGWVWFTEGQPAKISERSVGGGFYNKPRAAYLNNALSKHGWVYSHTQPDRSETSIYTNASFPEHFLEVNAHLQWRHFAKSGEYLKSVGGGTTGQELVVHLNQFHGEK
jgi:hypothetical protein